MSQTSVRPLCIVEKDDMSEDDVIEQLYWDFTGDLRERLKYVKLCHKGDLDGDNDDLLWHFTRLSALKNMLEGKQVRLTDLAYSNDRNEIVYGLSRVSAVVNELCPDWTNSLHAATERRIADSAVQRFKSTFHIFAFCLSNERDTVQHWNGYGGGLHNIPVSDDPYVAVGFDAQSLFYPIELSDEATNVYVINTVNGDDSADHLIQYWAIKARKMLELLYCGRVPLSKKRAFDTLERMLILVCALVKNEGWRDEHEYRLLYITDKFGEDEIELPQRPCGFGRYVPVKWSPDRLPIRALIPHPLADAKRVEELLLALPGGQTITTIHSALRPRPKQYEC
jgi:hypothetical protein